MRGNRVTKEGARGTQHFMAFLHLISVFLTTESMKKVILLFSIFIFLPVFCSVSAQNISMLNEVGSTIGLGSNPGGMGGPLIGVTYTGGVSVGEYFSTGMSIGYMSLLFSNGISTEVLVRGSVPFGSKAIIGAWLSASGGYDFAIGSSKVVPAPLLSGSGGLYFRFKNGSRLYVGPSYIGAYQPADTADHKAKGWGKYLAIKTSYSF